LKRFAGGVPERHGTKHGIRSYQAIEKGQNYLSFHTEPWTDEDQVRFGIPACGRQVTKINRLGDPETVDPDPEIDRP